MTRTETIAGITAKLSPLDDEAVRTVAGIVDTMSDQPSVLPRQLTARELALIEQSKEDFRAGRTYSLEEARAISKVYLKQRRAERHKA